MVTVAIDKYVEINQDDVEWNQVAENQIEHYPRATFELSADCPSTVAKQIMKAYDAGYFKLKAYIPESQILQEMISGRIKIDE